MDLESGAAGIIIQEGRSVIHVNLLETVHYDIL